MPGRSWFLSGEHSMHAPPVSVGPFMDPTLQAWTLHPPLVLRLGTTAALWVAAAEAPSGCA